MDYVHKAKHKNKTISNMASKPINISLIGTGSHILKIYEYLKIILSIDTGFGSLGIWPLWDNKTGFNLLIFLF